MKKMTLRLLVISALIISSLFCLVIFQPIEMQQNSLYSEISQLKGDPQEKTILENRKIFQDVRRLEIENNRAVSIRGKFIEIAPSLTALAALIAGVIAVFRYLSEIENQEKKDFNQRDKELKIRDKELNQERIDKERAFEEKFAAILGNLCSDSLDLQAYAAVALLGIIKPINIGNEYLVTVLHILAVNLKKELNKSSVILELLTRALEKNIQLMLKLSNKLDDLKELNLSRTKLIRLDLEGLDFSGIEVDIAFADLTDANLKDTKLNGLLGIEVILNKAKLSRAELKKARLNNAKCEGAHFHNSILISATLKGAILKKAEFMQAQLQAAHFEGADLTGAKFEDADINDTYFKKAILDDFAKKSLINAKNWKRIEKTEGVDRVEGAHFDDDVLKELLDLESKRHQKTEV